MNITKNILLLIVSPEYGWKEIKKYNVPKEVMLSKTFYPSLAFLALSAFVPFFYAAPESLSFYLKSAIMLIGEYFFGYMISAIFLCSVCKEINRDENGANKINIFTLYCYMLLMLLSIFENLIPISIPIFQLLPLYLIFIIWRGIIYFKSEIEEIRFVVLFSIGILIPPVLLKLLFNLFIP